MLQSAHLMVGAKYCLNSPRVGRQFNCDLLLTDLKAVSILHYGISGFWNALRFTSAVFFVVVLF